MTRIVLVDDDLLQLKLNKTILEAEGFDVFASSDATLALDDARSRRPDLIVSDVLMGDVDGFGLCRRVKADGELAGIPVLLLSAHYSGERNAQLATRVGARALVERSVGFERELESIRTCLNSPEPESHHEPASMYEAHLRSNADQLQRLQKRFSVMFEAANVGISVVSSEGFIVEANPYWEQLLGFTPAEMIGRHISSFALDAGDSAFVERMRQAFDLNATRVVEPLKHRDGRIVWIEIARKMVEVDGVPQMMAISHDVSARVEAEHRASEAEAKRKRLSERFSQAQKMDALGRLTGGIAHDFNNILAVIITHAYFLTEELAVTDPRLADVKEIAHAGERAAALTKQLLSFSRQQHLALAPTDVNAVIHNLARMLHRLIGEDVKLEIDTNAVGTVRADASQLEQVIVNLVVNARDAMPSGGTVSIETSQVVGEGLEAGEWVVLAVRDEGCGMDEGTKRRLFEPFFTTKEKGKGTGLGLSTSYGIVKQFGGHILFDSEVGAGTVMKVMLPIVDEVVQGPPARSSQRAQRGNETVLLVEDDRAVRAALTRVMVERGYDVLAAGSLGEAVACVEGHERAVELIVCDVVMPGASGPEAVARLMELAPRARVLLMSGYTDHALLGDELVSGKAFLQKPFTPDVFLHNVRSVLEGEQQ